MTWPQDYRENEFEKKSHIKRASHVLRYIKRPQRWKSFNTPD